MHYIRPSDWAYMALEKTSPHASRARKRTWSRGCVKIIVWRFTLALIRVSGVTYFGLDYLGVSAHQDSKTWRKWKTRRRSARLCKLRCKRLIMKMKRMVRISRSHSFRNESRDARPTNSTRGAGGDVQIQTLNFTEIMDDRPSNASTRSTPVESS